MPRVTNVTVPYKFPKGSTFPPLTFPDADLKVTACRHRSKFPESLTPDQMAQLPVKDQDYEMLMVLGDGALYAYLARMSFFGCYQMREGDATSWRRHASHEKLLAELAWRMGWDGDVDIDSSYDLSDTILAESVLAHIGAVFAGTPLHERATIAVDKVSAWLDSFYLPKWHQYHNLVHPPSTRTCSQYAGHTATRSQWITTKGKWTEWRKLSQESGFGRDAEEELFPLGGAYGFPMCIKILNKIGEGQDLEEAQDNIAPQLIAMIPPTVSPPTV